MKRFLASMAISLGLIIVYLVVSTVFVVAVSQDIERLDPKAIAIADLPLRAPKYAFYSLFPPTAADYSTNIKEFGAKKAFLAIGFFIVNVLLYAIPVFIILTFVGRFRDRSGRARSITRPPEPPTFLDTK